MAQQDSKAETQVTMKCSPELRQQLERLAELDDRTLSSELAMLFKRYVCQHIPKLITELENLNNSQLKMDTAA